MATASFEHTLDQQLFTENVSVLTVKNTTELNEDEPVTESITDKVRKVVVTLLQKNSKEGQFAMHRTWENLGVNKENLAGVVIDVEELVGIPPTGLEQNINREAETVGDLVAKFEAADAHYKGRRAR